MTTTPNEPVQDPEVVPSGDPSAGQPADVEPGDVAENPTDPDEDPGVDLPGGDSDEPVTDPTQVAETEAAEEPAGQ